MDDRVRIIPFSILAENQALFPDRVTRTEPTPADRAAGYPGALSFLDVSRINFGTLDTSGIDLSASYLRDSSFGRFRPSMTVTWVGKYESHDLPGLPASDQVNEANLFGTIPRWRGMTSLSWERGTLGFGTNVRYVPAYDDVDVVTNKPTGHRVRSQIQFDLQSTVDFKDFPGGILQGLAGLRLTAGILNVADAEPPFSRSSSNGYDITQADVRGRFYYVNFLTEF